MAGDPPPLRLKAVGTKGLAKRAAQDAAYRAALGLDADGKLPGKLGSGESAGGARGGPGASGRRRKKGRRGKG